MARPTSYKTKLTHVLEIKAEGIAGLYNRVKLLTDVFDDPAFREDIGGDDYSLADVLNKYVDDCALTFLELRSVLQAFPNACDWIHANLRSLLATALERSTPAKDETAQKSPRRTVTIKEFERVEEKLKDAEYRGKTLMDEVSELRSDNRRLVAENARLEGRIVELERSIERYSKHETSHR